LTALGFPLTTTHYDKRLNDFGRRVRKKYIKTTICVDDKSQITVAYDVYFRDIRGSKEFKKILRVWTGK